MIGNWSIKSRFLELKRFWFQGRANERKFDTGFRGLSFDNKFLDRAKECRQLGGVTDRKKIPQYARIVIAKKDSALVWQLDCVKRAEMVAKRPQIGGAYNETAPVGTPTFTEDQFGKLGFSFEPDQVRRDGCHIRLQFTAIKAAIFGFVLEEVFNKVRNGSAIEDGENGYVTLAKEGGSKCWIRALSLCSHGVAGCSTAGAAVEAASCIASAEGENFFGVGGLGAVIAVSLEPG